MFTLLAALLLAVPPPPPYTVRGEVGDQTLEIMVDGKLVDSVTNARVEIVAVEDFDGDGQFDALVADHCGGNGCDWSSRFVTVRGGKVLAAGITDTRDLPESVRVRGQALVKADELDAVVLYAFDSGKAHKVRSDAKPRLHPTSTVKGTAPMEAGKPRVLKVDVDLDGKADRVVCEVWERWGSLLCALPGPGGVQKLTMGCDTFGPLASRSNDHREFACGPHHLVHFDGKAWTVTPL